MQAYLINPFAQTITQVEYTGNYQQIYDLIDAETFDVARINEHGDGIFIDDEGLIREKDQAFFKHKEYPQPLAGLGLVLGCDDEGESVAPFVTINELVRDISWVMPVRVNGGGIMWVNV
ncbi:MAG: hypothetical protein ACK5SP_02225 [bacterium]|jgi:hypothetical protein